MSKALVCLPTLNEQQSVKFMIESVQALGLDVVVCDAGSTDGTPQTARQMGVPVIERDIDRRGKGAGVQKALRYAHEHSYDVLVLIDCDGTYPVNDIPRLLAHVEEYPLVVGARSQKQVAFVNAIGNHFFNFMVRVLFGGHMKDIHSGMRALRVATYLPLLDADNFDIEIQISCVTLKRNIPYLEFPINYSDRVGDSKVRYSDGIDVLLRMLKERFR